MSFMGGFAQGLAGGLSDQIQDRRDQFRESVNTYRQQAQAAYQSYVKTMNEQKAFKRQVENFAVQYFDGNVNAARSYLDQHNNDFAKASKDILDRGVPEVLGEIGPSLEQQIADIGLARQEGQLPGQQEEQAAADPVQQGVMDHVRSFGKKLFGPVDISEVRAHVAAEMGMDPEQLHGIMMGAYNQAQDYTPVQLGQNRIALSDLTSADGALLKIASIPDEQLSPGMRAVKAEAIRINAERNASRAASGLGGAADLFNEIRKNAQGGPAFEPTTRESSQRYRRENFEDEGIPMDLPDGTQVMSPDGVPHVVYNGRARPL